ncbi:MAG TPA: TAT-variant-translocated molybdopterin oxidoreductase [Gemmataceae bacterium]|nr:TAT-variant-translocated molybdopterin oxidoreductase [Gemmataceae bacterium]
MGHTTDATPPAPAGGSKDIWRGLEEWAQTPEFTEMLQREFPEDATAWTDPVTRRTFLTLAGATAALAGAGCSPRPASKEPIYPYAKQPEQITLGLPLFFATGFTLAGTTVGILAKSREGRPIKLEGNPDHPSCLGGIDSVTQASLLNLYDPDRSRQVMRKGVPTAYNTALNEVRLALDRLKANGKTVRVLTESIGSPTLRAVLGDFLRSYGLGREAWVQYDAVDRANVRQGARDAFGTVVTTTYDFSKAKRVFSLDGDFMGSMPGSVRYSRDFSRNRNTHLRGDRVPTAEEMSRLYVAESMLTTTGAVADHRLPVRSADVELIAQALAKAVGVGGAADVAIPDAYAREFVAKAAADLKALGAESVVVPGDHQPPAVHALAHAINQTLGSVGAGKPVQYRAADDADQPSQTDAFKALVADMAAKRVDCLLILGANPAFTAPADMDFKGALARVGLKVHLGSHLDETGVLCDYHFNETHYLETWGDGRAHDGTVTICQPLIAPLFDGRSALDLLVGLTKESANPSAKDAIADRAGTSPRELVKAYWEKNWPQGSNGGSFEDRWQTALRDGVIPGTEWPAANPPAAKVSPYTPAAAGLEVNFRADPCIYDGRYANNAWLQELPKPITKLTWDNAAIISPKTAKKLNIGRDFKDEHGRVERRAEEPLDGGGSHGKSIVHKAELTVDGRKLVLPVWIQPGHADESITVYLGYGRERAGKVGNNTGFNTYAVRNSKNPSTVVGVELKGTGDEFVLACTQSHHSMEGRRPVRAATLAEFKENYAGYKQDPDAYAPFAKVPAVAAPHWRAIEETLPGSPHEIKANKGHDHHEHEGHGHHDKRLTPLTMYPPTSKEGDAEAKRRWAMAIDLTLCNGCSACVSACMAENNTAAVGKKEVTRGREMHWIRVDRYYEGDDPDDAANIATHVQPVPCQQCEKAPCEVVCPVAATMHSHDGLNDMVYNRCVGTRYCSNNCPYKVRRFNFLTYGDWKTDTFKLMRNPEVTVRERGVMEKCTYCVQRIRAAEIEAERTFRNIEDGEVVTACQQACPTGAIIFGDLALPNAKIHAWKKQPLNYGLLAELNTQPRTTYLAAIRNPNPDMPKPTKGA